MAEIDIDVDKLLKIILVGDSGVGKSALLHQFLYNTYKEDHEITIGIEFGSITLRIEHMSVKLQIWDTAGQDMFRSIVRTYYRRAQGAILVYDVTDEESFNNVQDWMCEIYENAPLGLQILLVGNKCDLEDKRKISYEKGQDFAIEKGVTFIETSALNGENVQAAFEKIAKDLVGLGKEAEQTENSMEKTVEFDNTIHVLNQPRKISGVKDSSCC